MTRIGYAAKRAGARPAERSRRIPRRLEGSTLRCSFAQEQFWYVDQLAPGNRAYTFSWATRLRGPLDVPALDRALAEVVRRHEALRTRFVVEDGRPVQAVGDEPFVLDVDDVSEEADPDGAARRVVDDESARPFDLGGGDPAFRARLVRLSDDDHVLHVVVHHIVFDEWSKVVLYRELAAIYEAFTAGRPSPLADPPVQFGDFAEWQRSRPDDDVQADLAYWRGELEGAPTILELPADRQRPTVATLRGARRRLPIPPRLTAALDELAEAGGATLFDGLLALFEVLLHRYTGESDFVVGTPADDRALPELDDTVGVLLGTIVLRSDLSANATFRELVRRVGVRVRQADEHAGLPFELLVRELQPERDLSRHPLYQVLLAINPPDPELRLAGLESEVVGTEAAAAGVDLFLFLQERDGGFDALWEYSTDLFDAETIERMHGHFVRLLEEVTADPDRQVGELPLMGDDERRRLLEAGAGRHESYPDLPLHGLVEAQAGRTPDEVAVVFEGQQLTYAELDARANALARRLQGAGVETGSLVAVSLERSLGLPVALLATLKAGGAYVPLDPDLPHDRLEFMLVDSGAKVLVTQRHLVHKLPRIAGEVVVLDADGPSVDGDGEALDLAVGPDDAAYVIYTSGSTGRPKGVPNTHRGIVNRLLSMQDTYALDGSDRVLQKTQTSFDVAVREVFWPLTVGARLVLAAPGSHGNPAYLADLIERERISVVHFVPSMLQLFLEEVDARRLGSIRCVLSGGEELTAALARRFFERLDCELHNLYGPTEAAVSVTSWRCGPDDGPVVPIGRPVANTQLYVVDPRLEPVPVGVWGELLIGGAQVALGYLGRPELTAERFVPNPFGAGRLYRTGDRFRWTVDGVLQFGGRIDDQVKIRGFRVELGEVAAVLREHASVADAAVVAYESASGRSELAAYVVLQGDATSARADLGSSLRGQLPDYMVPGSITFVDALPLLPSGKLDRNALPPPERPTVEDGYEEPAGGVEQELATLWGELLEVDRVGRTDNFFALGGHSLLAVRLVGRVGKRFGIDLELSRFLRDPTVAALAREVASGEREPAPEPELPPLVARTSSRECSFAQERFWFVDQVMGNSAAYNIPVGARLRGELDRPALERALSEIVRRHEILRTRFAAEDGRPVQVVEPPRPVPLEALDLSALPEEERELELRRLVDEQAQTAFDVARGPFFSVRLIRLAEDDHVLHIVFSHLVFDGWSKLVLFRELGALYSAYATGTAPVIEELGVQYADFAEWQRSWLQGDLLERELEHWRGSLAGLPDSLELPFDRQRPETASLRGAWSRTRIPAQTLEGLQALSRSEGTTLYMTLLAVFDVLLHRYSGQDDIAVGMPVDSRDRGELEDAIGVFVDTVVMRVDLSGDVTFRSLLDRVRTRMLDAIAHQRLPFEQLVRALEPDRRLDRHPLYQVMLTLVPSGPAPGLAGLEVEEVAAQRASSPIDLTVFLEERDGGYEAVWEYSTDLFDAQTIERMQRHFQRLLDAVVADPGAPIGALEMLSEAERSAALSTGDKERRAGFPVACLHELFERRVSDAPHARAASYEGETLTYEELNVRANRLAHELRDLGVGAETLVALCLERSLDLVVAILAVLKAGGAYVPLDPDYPADRLAFVLSDAQPRVLLTQERLRPRLPAHEAAVLCIDDADALAGRSEANPEPLAEPENLAYVIYTSGSTGKPKGVQVEHRQVARLFSATDEWYGFGPDDTWLLFHSYAFDFSVWEYWGALLHGGRLVVAPLWTTRSPDALARLLVDEQVTVLNATPTLFLSVQDELVEAGYALAIRVVVFGGEALRPSALRPWFTRFGPDGPTLVNMYGITETTVHVTYRPLGAADVDRDVSPIGEPIPDLQLYLLDSHLNPVPPGVPGELFVGGAGVARGYLNRPELNAERFLESPFGEGRLYRSGDSARYREDGEIEFLGRIDDQVKIRGFRIELGEIEAALTDEESVSECAVVAFETDASDTRLAAYIVPAGHAGGQSPNDGMIEDGAPLDPAGAERLRAELRTALEAKLPVFMVPASITLLPSLPLTVNGKLDRRSLPPPVWEEQAEGDFVAPRTPTEREIAEIWQRVLRVERVGADDNFFHLGGHSLLAARVVTQVRKRFSVDISVRAVFQQPTLSGLAAHVDAAGGRSGDEESGPARPDAVEHAYPPSFSQQQLLFIDELVSEIATYNGAFAVRIVGDLDVQALEDSIADVVGRHESLRTVFRLGPDEPSQVVLDEWQSELVVVDLAAVPGADRPGELQRRLRDETRRPFDLERDLMVRTTLFSLGDAEHVLLVVTHHIASDGWSVGVFCRDVGELYNARRAGRSPRLPDLPHQYRDFARWQRDRLQGELLEREVAHWRAELAGAPTILQLPSGLTRPAHRSFEAASHPVAMPADVAAGVRRLCLEAEVTPYVLLLSVFGLLLYRLSGQDDILVGGPYANRSRSEYDDLIGFFANTMVMRLRLAGNPTFADLLGRVGESVLGALDHQEFPFELVVEAVRPSREVGVNPLVQVNFRVRVEPPAALELTRAATEHVPIDVGFAAFELALDLQVLEDEISGELIYDTDLFDRESVERFAADYEALLLQVLERPEARLLSLRLGSDGNAPEARPAGGIGIRGFRDANGAPGHPSRRRTGAAG